LKSVEWLTKPFQSERLLNLGFQPELFATDANRSRLHIVTFQLRIVPI